MSFGYISPDAGKISDPEPGLARYWMAEDGLFWPLDLSELETAQRVRQLAEVDSPQAATAAASAHEPEDTQSVVIEQSETGEHRVWLYVMEPEPEAELHERRREEKALAELRAAAKAAEAAAVAADADDPEPPQG